MPATSILASPPQCPSESIFQFNTIICCCCCRCPHVKRCYTRLKCDLLCVIDKNEEVAAEKKANAQDLCAYHVISIHRAVIYYGKKEQKRKRKSEKNSIKGNIFVQHNKWQFSNHGHHLNSRMEKKKQTAQQRQQKYKYYTKKRPIKPNTLHTGAHTHAPRVLISLRMTSLCPLRT